MRFQDTRFWKNYNLYDKIVEGSSIRSTVDGLVYWKLLNAFEFNNFLEIGIYQGLTTGLFFDSNPNCRTTAIDPIDRLDLFYKLYPEGQDQLSFINLPSQQVNLVDKYDFILIDGDHSYEHAWYDIQSSLPLLNPNSVLAIDDYKLSGVAKAIDNLYNANSGLVPFIRAEQTEFWHYPQCNRELFLDSLLTDPISKFIFIQSEIDRNNTTVLTAKTISMLTDYPTYFDLALKQYNI